MEKSFVETVLRAEAGSIVTVKPDIVVINDGVSSGAVDKVSKVAAPDRVMVMYDHDVPTGSSEAAGIFIKINRFAKTYGLRFVQGKGIGYQFLLDEEINHGEIIVGGGSHGSIFGAKGALGINTDTNTLAALIETGTLQVTVPETLYVHLEGNIPANANAMDAAMTLLAARRDIAGKALEFFGDNLPPHDKTVLCSMACLTGAFTASFNDTVASNTAAAFTLDLSSVKPMAMMPCGSREEQSTAQITPLTALYGTSLNAGQIGGYTGGTIDALRRAAKMMEGRNLALGFRLSVCPATSRDYLFALDEGLIEIFLDYGAQVHAAGDHSVVIQGPGTVDSYESLITTGLYTFDGCMGSKGAKVYCASEAAVVAASSAKKIVEV